MFYDAPGRLLTQAGQLLAETPAGPEVVTQLRPIGIQLARLGAIWPRLFDTLARETDVLRATRAEIATILDDAGVAHALDRPDPADPIERYDALLRQLDDLLPVLHEHRSEPWGRAALAMLRAGIAAAGRIQGDMVELAWPT